MIDAVARAFHDTHAPSHRVLHGIIWALVAVSVLLVMADIWGPAEFSRHPAVVLLDRAVLILFTIELTLRVLTYHPPALEFWSRGYLGRLRLHLQERLRYLFTPMMLIDLVTVLALVPALRGLRVLRLLRLIRVRSWFKHSNPLQGTLRAFHENRLLYFAAYSLLAVGTVLGGLTIYLIEGVDHSNPGIDSVLDGMWWSIVTLTTVGFGDIAPVSGLGRVVAAFLMVQGMFVLALFAGIVGSTLIGAVGSMREEQFRMTGYTDHVVICGFDSGTRMLLDALLREPLFGDREIVIFAPGDRPADVPPELLWVRGDPTKESELGKVKLSHAGAVIVVGNRASTPQAADASTILTVFTLRSWMATQPETKARRTPLYIVAEILDEENVRHCKTAGADEVIESTRLAFSLLAHAIAMPGTAEAVAELAGVEGHSVYVGRADERVTLPAVFQEVARQLRQERGVLLVGIRDGTGGHDRLNPPIGTRVTDADGLIYIAEAKTLPKW